MKKGNVGAGFIGTEGGMSDKQKDKFVSFLFDHFDGENCNVTLIHGGEEGSSEEAHWMATDMYCDKIIIPCNEDREEYWLKKACCSQSTILDIEDNFTKRLDKIISRSSTIVFAEGDVAKDNKKTLDLIGKLGKKKKDVLILKR